MDHYIYGEVSDLNYNRGMMYSLREFKENILSALLIATPRYQLRGINGYIKDCKAIDSIASFSRVPTSSEKTVETTRQFLEEDAQ